MENSKENRAFIVKYLDAMSGHVKTRELCEEYTTDEGLIEHILFFDGAFPKYELFIEEMVTEGDKVVVRGRATGTHKGELNGIPPTYREMDLPFMIRYTVKNNMITDHWILADQMLLMEQLGVMETKSEKSA